jgi:RNA polymerase sigma factor (TIGR02999 family)
MRRILVEHARARKADKRGGGKEVVALDENIVSPETPRNLLTLDEALTRLQEFAPRQSQIVEMRFFGGMSISETAEALGVGVTTVKEEWNLAKAWLRREIEEAR